MQRWRTVVLATILLGSSAAVAHAQVWYPVEPLRYPADVSPDYYPPGPGSTPYGPAQPGAIIPLGAPIPGTVNQKQVYEEWLKSQRNQGGDPMVQFDDAPNAFPLCEPNENPNNQPEGRVYLSLGAMALQRNRLGDGGVAFQEPKSATPGISTYPTTVTPQLLGYNDIAMNNNWGFRGTLGYQVGDYAVELVGWKVWGTNSFQVEADKDNLYLPFAAYPPPLGVGGGGNNANTWLRVDQVRILDVCDLANCEANYRMGVGSPLQCLVGLRWLNVSERFDILSDQDGLTVSPTDPRFMITYRVQTHSNIFGPQVGFEWNQNLFFPWVGVGAYGKALVGANFYSVDVSVFRADGFTSLNNGRSNVTVSGAAELGLYLYLNPFPSGAIEFKAGYEALLVWNVPVANSEVAFDVVAQPYGTQRDSGSILFSGPFMEIIFNF